MNSQDSQGNDLRLKVEDWARPISHSMTTHSFTNYAYERAILYRSHDRRQDIYYSLSVVCFIG